MSPYPLSNLPKPRVGHTLTACAAWVSIWSCSTWGLPCHCCCQQRGALLPHHFTLTLRLHVRRYIFCGTCRRLTPPRHYLARYPMEPGLSSIIKDSDCLANSVCKANGLCCFFQVILLTLYQRLLINRIFILPCYLCRKRNGLF